MNSTYATNYQVLCIGVNEGPGGTTLNLAEKDATDIYNVFTGALGPPHAKGCCLTEQLATQQGVIGKLKALASQPPRFLLLYFSGHGNETGILLSNGLLGYGLLAAHLRQINTQTTLIIFDTCHAAAYGGFVREDEVAGIGEDEFAWAKMLAESRPGTRLLFSTSATTLSHEASNNGRFTTAFLDALNEASGDIGPENNFVSALQAFNVTYGLMLARWGKGQLPQKLGELGDFPLVRSQVGQSVGTAEIVSVSIAKGLSTDLEYLINGRNKVATVLGFALVDGLDTALYTGSVIVVPTSSSYSGTYQICTPRDALRRHPHLRAVLDSGGIVQTQWGIVIQDQRGRLLADKTCNFTYWKLPPPMV